MTDAIALRDAELSQGRRLERSAWDELIADKVIDKLRIDEIPTFREQALHLWT